MFFGKEGEGVYWGKRMEGEKEEGRGKGWKGRRRRKKGRGGREGGREGRGREEKVNHLTRKFREFSVASS